MRERSCAKGLGTMVFKQTYPVGSLFGALCFSEWLFRSCFGSAWSHDFTMSSMELFDENSSLSWQTEIEHSLFLR